MKEITVIFENPSTPPSSLPSFPSEHLNAAAKLIESLCEETDFARRFDEFLKSSDWEVPTVSWRPPPAT